MSQTIEEFLRTLTPDEILDCQYLLIRIKEEMGYKEQPSLEKLRGVIYVYTDSSQYEMIDVQNYIDNLQSIGGFTATHSYLSIKPVRWQKITPNVPKNG